MISSAAVVHAARNGKFARPAAFGSGPFARPLLITFRPPGVLITRSRSRPVMMRTLPGGARYPDRKTDSSRPPGRLQPLADRRNQGPSPPTADQRPRPGTAARAGRDDQRHHRRGTGDRSAGAQ